MTPETRPVNLVDGWANPPCLVPATLIVDFPPERLEEVESTWTPARDSIARELAESGIESEHSHWDWRRKKASAKSGKYRIVAVECADAIQGLMALLTKPRQSGFDDDENLVLYVDFLEAAPWNLKRKSNGPRFLGVGTVMIGCAVSLSVEAGLGGRIGLHSLPQAERFYQKNCGLTNLGPDPRYYDLVYFEFTAAQAQQWIAKERSSS